MKYINLGLYAILCLLCFFVPRFFAYGPLIIGLMGIITLWLQKRELTFPLFYCGGVGILFALFIMGGFFTEDVDVLTERIFKLLPIFVFGGALITCANNFIYKSDHYIKTVLACVVLSPLMFGGFEFYSDLWVHKNLITGDQQATYPSMLNRHVVALSLCIAPLIWVLSAGRSKAGMSAASLSSLLLAFILFRTWSQAAQLGVSLFCLAGIAYYIAPKIIQSLSRLILPVLTLTAPFLVISVFEAFDFSQGFQTGSFLNEAAAHARLEIWYGISNRILQQPLTGYGIEATRWLTISTPGYFWDKDTVLHPHNFILQFWLEHGVLGALFLSGGFLLALREITKIQDKLLAAFAYGSFIAWIGISATAYGFWQSWWIGLSLFLLACWVVIIRHYGFRDKSDVLSDNNEASATETVLKDSSN